MNDPYSNNYLKTEISTNTISQPEFSNKYLKTEVSGTFKQKSHTRYKSYDSDVKSSILLLQSFQKEKQVKYLKLAS